jgi:hypothetical protein
MWDADLTWVHVDSRCEQSPWGVHNAHACDLTSHDGNRLSCMTCVYCGGYLWGFFLIEEEPL